MVFDSSSTPAQIRQVTGFSQRLVNEYLDIFSYYNKSKNERLQLLLQPKELKKTKEQK